MMINNAKTAAEFVGSWAEHLRDARHASPGRVLLILREVISRQEGIAKSYETHGNIAAAKGHYAAIRVLARAVASLEE